jgi:hypothetical protein
VPAGRGLQARRRGVDPRVDRRSVGDKAPCRRCDRPCGTVASRRPHLRQHVGPHIGPRIGPQIEPPIGLPVGANCLCPSGSERARRTTTLRGPLDGRGLRDGRAAAVNDEEGHRRSLRDRPVRRSRPADACRGGGVARRSGGGRDRCHGGGGRGRRGRRRRVYGGSGCGWSRIGGGWRRRGTGCRRGIGRRVDRSRRGHRRGRTG